jgi:hypothetical protein
MLFLAEKRGTSTVLCMGPIEETVRSLYSDAPQVSVECTHYWSRPWILDHAGRMGEKYDVFLPGTLWDWDEFAPLPFDARFYAQCGVPLENKWRRLPKSRSSCEKALFDKLNPGRPYSLVHDDPGRRMGIESSRVLQPSIRITQQTGNMLDWRLLAERATEIHCIDSSFLSFVELLAIDGLEAKKYFHIYARRGQSAPTYTVPTLLSDWNMVGKP